MVAHYHGQVWNSAEPARSLGVAESTARRYLNFLSNTNLVRQPWFKNRAKRQVKAPKAYVRDSGLLHALFNLTGLDAVLAHPKAGASWEGFLLEEVLEAARPDQAYFWATHQGGELDLLMLKGNRRVGVEVKRADAPTMTPSMRIAMADLKLDALFVLYPGAKRYRLADRVEVLPATSVAEFAA
jgi:predicted AAA+ superfamily ATPase